MLCEVVWKPCVCNKHTLSGLLLVNPRFFMCHMYRSEIEQLSVPYTESNAQDYWSATAKIIRRSLTRLLVL